MHEPGCASVHQQNVDIPAACRSWYAQCTLCSRPWTFTGTVLWMVVDAPVVVQRQVPWLCRAEYCGVSAVVVVLGVVQFLDKVVVPVGATTAGRAMLGSTTDTCYYPGWLLEEFFTIFHVEGLIRLLSSIHVLLFWPAHRRQRQWHEPFLVLLF